MLISRLPGLIYRQGHTYDIPPTYIGIAGPALGTKNETLAVPSGYAEGDLLVLIVSTGTSDGASTPEGWSLIGSRTSTVSPVSTIGVFYKWASSSESSVTYTSSADNYGVMLVYRGVDLENPIDASITDVSSGTSFSANAPATNVPNCMMIVAVGFGDNGSSDSSNYSNWANSSFSSIDERVDQFSFRGLGIAIATGVKPLAGSTNATSATADSKNNSSAVLTLALTPAA